MIDNYLIEIQLNNNYKIDKSNIHGNGVISTQRISKGEFINIALVPNNVNWPETTNFGKYLNHSKTPNAVTKLEKDNVYRTYCSVDINSDDEITVDYTINPELEQPLPGWK